MPCYLRIIQAAGRASNGMKPSFFGPGLSLLVPGLQVCLQKSRGCSVTAEAGSRRVREAGKSMKAVELVVPQGLLA